MNEAQVRGLEQVREVLEGTQSLEFRRAEDDQGRYAWIESVLWGHSSFQTPSGSTCDGPAAV